MFEVFGQDLAQDMDDPPWIEYASEQGLAILTKDFLSLRYREPFKTVQAREARVFALASARLPGDKQIECFRTNQRKIYRAARRKGPYIYKVYADTITLVWP